MENLNIYLAISKAQQNFDKILKSKDNPFFKSKYADLNAILDAVTPALREEQLLIFSKIENGEVITKIIHDDNTFIQSNFPIPQGLDIQKIGGAITYGRRYNLQALLNLQAHDDDGNATMGVGKPAPVPVPAPAPKKKQPLTLERLEKAVEAGRYDFAYISQYSECSKLQYNMYLDTLGITEPTPKK